MEDKFENGEVFVYTNGDKWELGQVKAKARDDAYFCWYSTGDTAACTPVRCMHKLANAGFSHLEREDNSCEWVLEHSGTLYDKFRCSKCGFLFVEPRCDQGYVDLEPNFCPSCGRSVRE